MAAMLSVEAEGFGTKSTGARALAQDAGARCPYFRHLPFPFVPSFAVSRAKDLRQNLRGGSDEKAGRDVLCV
jgi:hypothetical protein